jgi:hypothetical protein
MECGGGMPDVRDWANRIERYGVPGGKIVKWFLIWNARSEVYWREDRQGYTRHVYEAGLYDELTAKRLARREEREKVIPLDDVKDELKTIGIQVHEMLLRGTQ